MRLSISKTYKVNMGNYEHVEVGGHVTLDAEDLGYSASQSVFDPDAVMDELRAEAQRYLDAWLEPELKKAAGLSQADASMLIEPPPPPRRTERTTRRRSTR